LVYVADSSPVTSPNLAVLHPKELALIPRRPGRFGATWTAKTAAGDADDWEDLGQIAWPRNAAQYWASEQTGLIDDAPYRLLIYQSSALDAL